MSKWFYYNENGEKIEVTGGQLKGLAKAGMITPETIIETEDGKTAPARKVKGLPFAETAQPESPGTVNWFYYDAKGQKVGPVPFNVLQSLAENGVITQGTAIESADRRTAIAGSIEGLIFAKSSSPSQPIPPVPVTSNLSDVFNTAMNDALSGSNAPSNVPEPFTLPMSDDNPFSQSMSQYQSEPPVKQYQSAAPVTQYQSVLPVNGGMEKVPLILGYIGLGAWLIPILGLPITITGLVMAIKGNSKLGTILCAIGLGLSVINAVIGAFIGASG